MTSQIVSNTPLWVWGLLLALFWLGTNQLMMRTASLGRVVRMALLMAAFSLYGTVSASGSSPGAIAAWVAAVATVGWFVSRASLAEGTQYLPQQRAFVIPGSWVPLALMLGLFAVKYLAGVSIALGAPIVHTALFGPLLGLVYGGFSGVFLGRAGRLVQLAQRTPRMPQAVQA